MWCTTIIEACYIILLCNRSMLYQSTNNLSAYGQLLVAVGATVKSPQCGFAVPVPPFSSPFIISLLFQVSTTAGRSITSSISWDWVRANFLGTNSLQVFLPLSASAALLLSDSEVFPSLCLSLAALGCLTRSAKIDMEKLRANTDSNVTITNQDLVAVRQLSSNSFLKA